MFIFFFLGLFSFASIHLGAGAGRRIGVVHGASAVWNPTVSDQEKSKTKYKMFASAVQFDLSSRQLGIRFKFARENGPKSNKNEIEAKLNVAFNQRTTRTHSTFKM